MPGESAFFEGLSSFKNYKARSITSITGSLAFGTRLSKTNLNMDHLDHVLPGETVTLAEMEGPGEITHIWFTLASEEPGWPRKVMLRMFWDGEKTPSVEAPIGDFFGLGHGMVYRYRIVAADYRAPGMIDAPMMPAAPASTEAQSQ